MSVAAKSCIPSVIVAGDTIIFSVVPGSRYPNTDWTLKFVLSRDGTFLRSWDAINADIGLGFLVTLPKADTAKLTAGRANASLIYTETSDGQRETDGPYQILVSPDPTQSLPDSAAATALKAVNAAIAKLAADPYLTVNFNGQSYTGRNPKELMDIRDRLSVTVSAELAELGIGSRRGGAKLILARFR